VPAAVPAIASESGQRAEDEEQPHVAGGGHAGLTDTDDLRRIDGDRGDDAAASPSSPTA
jgi:hypothetical protein